MNHSERFTGKADAYSRYRPSYPNEYIDYLLSANLLKEASSVADIGSGTGILSKQLLGRGLQVIGVEPNDDMRSLAEHELNQIPRFTSINATAEDTGLSTNTIDLVTVAQAFHWFNTERFKGECQRILKNDANVALVWNSKDLSSPIYLEMQELFHQMCPSFKGFSGGIEESPQIYDKFFNKGKFEFRSYINEWILDYESFIGRNLSSSYSLQQTEKGYGQFITALSDLFEKYSTNGEIRLPKITKSYLGKV
ncbi:class I SAM-dependent methyltransferase [Sutcliffiella halmapala]|uniref:class I SAM-dependent methyltransferase n=1 Tax=Sutcliffiella halmapala TaxID=79882 RepID=UPI00111710D4|nr:class I SAM-dependent methyltransferase [Sutcliffiella halmapala]